MNDSAAEGTRELARLRDHVGHLTGILDGIQTAETSDELHALGRSLVTSMRLTVELLAQAETAQRRAELAAEPNEA